MKTRLITPLLLLLTLSKLPVLLVSMLLSSSIAFADMPDPKEGGNKKSTFIPVYVLPYYASSRDGKTAPTVKVATSYNALLSSKDKNDIIKAEKMIKAAPDMITPMAMMVLAIRFYDVDLRDKAVFWFYAAKDRYTIFQDIVKIKNSNLGFDQVDDAVKSFASLAGGYINGYAFCDIANQQKIRREAFQWVKDNPYKVLWVKDMPLKTGKLEANRQKAMDDIKVRIEKETVYLNDKAKLANFKKTRKENHMAEKYCW